MILMYHNIGLETGFNTISVPHFREQMNWLYKQGYQIISLTDYVSRLKKNKLDRKAVVLTFDDGYVSFETEVLPVLEKYNFPAALFISTGFIGKHNQWDVSCAPQKIPIMSWEQLQAIKNHPMVTIGSHGVDHTALSGLTPKEMTIQIRDSAMILNKVLNQNTLYFSYPYGQFKHFNKKAEKLLQQHGYQAACSTNWDGLNGFKTIFRLNRIEIEPQDELTSFQSKLGNKYHIKYFKQKIKNYLNFLGIVAKPIKEKKSD